MSRLPRATPLMTVETRPFSVNDGIPAPPGCSPHSPLIAKREACRPLAEILRCESHTVD